MSVKNAADMATTDSEAVGTSAANSVTDRGQLAEKDASVDKQDELSDYPTGFKLFMLVAAVMLTVFLTSLDQVSKHAWIGCRVTVH